MVGGGSHQNKLQAAIFVKEVLLVVVTGWWAILSQFPSLRTEGYGYYCVLGSLQQDANETE